MFELKPMYPPINFIGNKRKLVSWIFKCCPLKNGVFVDAFSGGCSVSYEAKKRGFLVYSNDCLYSCYVLSKALIENKLQRITKKDLSIVNSNIRHYKLNTSFLSDNIFYKNEVNELKTILNHCLSLKTYKKFLLLSLIRRSMIRKIPYSRFNMKWEQIKKFRNEDRNFKLYKRYRSYQNKSFYELISNDLSKYNNAVFDNGRKNKSFNLDVFQFLKKIKKADVIYFDPPYPNTLNDYDKFYGAFDKIFCKKNNHVNFIDKNKFSKLFLRLIKLSLTKSHVVIISINNNYFQQFYSYLTRNICINDVCGYKLIIKVFEKKHNYQVTSSKTKKYNIEKLIVIEQCAKK